jgi:hypothetical protein
MSLTMDEIRQKGLDALFRELGPLGMIRFLQQFEPGHGDYARERRKWVDRTSMGELRSAIQARQSKKRHGR